MNLLKIINENAKEDAGEKHINEERDYMEYGIKCLKGLIDYVNDEKTKSEDKSRIQDYKKIANQSKKLADLLQTHLGRYK